MTGFADNPDDLRRHPDLAEFADTKISLAAVFAAFQEGLSHVASYQRRTVDLAVEDGQRVIDVAATIADEAFEAMLMHLGEHASEVLR